jgi:hypothetical protein
LDDSPDRTFVALRADPFNLLDGIGAIAIVVDPAGHPIGLYSRTPIPPAPSPAK